MRVPIMGGVATDAGKERPIEVEVERLPEREPGERPRSGAGGAGDAVDPIMAGIVIDVLDAVTRGPRGAVFGLALGIPVGYWLGRRQGLGRKASLGLGGLCGVYCGFPGTAPVPLGTLIGLYRRFVPSS
ncbi:MAG: hypothetical protein QF903_02560 [Planctomycetota bacterium]|nr:hypothetical protein [Planctomycetota bacterium]